MAEPLKYPNVNEEDVQFWLEMTPYKSRSSLQLLGNNPDYSGDGFNPADSKNYKIRLQAPQQIISSDGHRWGQLDSGLIAQGIKGITEQGKEFFEKSGDLLKNIAENFFGDAAKEVGRALGDRTASNPFSEKYYEAPEFRTFTFSWEFAAESAEDAEKLSEIIEAIRSESYPTRTSGGTDLYRYEFPSEWKLEILEKEASTIRSHGRMAKSVLTNMSTNYTGAGIVSGFNRAGSHAPFVNLELTFSETNLNHSGSSMITPDNPSNYGY